MTEYLALWALVSLIASMLLLAIVIDHQLKFEDVVDLKNYTILGKVFYFLYVLLSLPTVLFVGSIGLLIWCSEKFIKKVLLK